MLYKFLLRGYKLRKSAFINFARKFCILQEAFCFLSAFSNAVQKSNQFEKNDSAICKYFQILYSNIQLYSVLVYYLGADFKILFFC